MRNFITAALALCLVCGAAILAQSGTSSARQTTAGAQDAKRIGKTSAPDESRAKPLNRKKTILLDYAGKRVLLKTKVCNRDAPLEMFCCLTQTKLHESILVLDAKAYQVHAALRLLKAKPGKTARYIERKEGGYDFIPASGQPVEIFVNWKDKAGKKHRHRAQKWVRHAVHRYFFAKLETLPETIKMPRKDELRYDTYRKELLWFGPMTDTQKKDLLALSDDPVYQKAIRDFHKNGQMREMESDFLFAGSTFFTDESTGKQHYAAEGGWLICVANMPQATIDIDTESSPDEGNNSYETWTERIPEAGTEVTIELIPMPERKPKTSTPKTPSPKKPGAKSDKKKVVGAGQ